MGWMTRFEPATSGSTDRRSNQLSYIHHKLVLYSSKFTPLRANKWAENSLFLLLIFMLACKGFGFPFEF